MSYIDQVIPFEVGDTGEEKIFDPKLYQAFLKWHRDQLAPIVSSLLQSKEVSMVETLNDYILKAKAEGFPPNLILWHLINQEIGHMTDKVVSAVLVNHYLGDEEE